MEIRVRVQTSAGEFVLALDDDRVPLTTANFLEYARAKHYDGTIFHRVIDGFMIQGGGYGAGLALRPTRPPIQNEADNGLRNARGTIAMARTADPHSATAQFFINVADNPRLDHTGKTPQGWGYAVFGRVVEGMDVVDRIKAAPTRSSRGHDDVPAEDVVIEAITVED